MEDALQYTQLITNIIIIMLFIGLVVLLLGVIKSMKKITETIEKFSKDFTDVKPKIYETVDKINSLSDNVSTIVKKVNENVDVLGTVMDKVKDTADSIIEFEKKIQSQIEPPVMETLNTITAVSVGIKTFMDKWKSSKKERNHVKWEEDKYMEIKESLNDVDKELDEVNSRLSDLQK